MPHPDPASPDRPGQDARLRRLLADARHSEPIPSDVAARLERVLEGLAEEEREPDAPAVTALDARRRRRTTQVLVAAVAVVAVGIGVNAVVGGDGGDEQSGSASSAADSAPESARESQPSSDPSLLQGDAESGDAGGSSSSQDSQDSQDSSGTADTPGATSLLTEPPVQAGSRTAFLVREDRFVRDVRRLRGVPGARVIDADQMVADSGLGGGPGFVCASASYGAGTLIPVRYQGDAAVLAYRVPTGDTQAVDLLQCGSAQLLRSTTIPARR